MRLQVDPNVQLYVTNGGGPLELQGTDEAPVSVDAVSASTPWNRLVIDGALSANRASLANYSALSVRGTASLHLGRVLGPLTTQSGSTVDAARTWWGSTAGPTRVSGPAVTRPYCLDPDCNDLYPHAQTVAFTSTPPADAVVGDTYTATATGGASGLPVVFSTSSAACTVSASGSVTFIAVGTCVIAARQAGNTDYSAAARVTQAVGAGPAPQTITFTSTAPTDAVPGGTYRATATGGGSGNPVVFSLGDPTEACSVADDGAVVFLAPGTCIVAADQAADRRTAARSAGRRRSSSHRRQAPPRRWRRRRHAGTRLR